MDRDARAGLATQARDAIVRPLNAHAQAGFASGAAEPRERAAGAGRGQRRGVRVVHQHGLRDRAAA